MMIGKMMKKLFLNPDFCQGTISFSAFIAPTISRDLRVFNFRVSNDLSLRLLVDLAFRLLVDLLLLLVVNLSMSVCPPFALVEKRLTSVTVFFFST